MDKRRVVITGMGIVSPLSLSIEEFWQRLISGSGGVRSYFLDNADSDLVAPPVAVAAPALFEGKIGDFDSRDATQQKTIRKALKLMSREIQMAVAASCRALNEAEIQIGQFPSDRIGISFGSDYIITTVEDVLDGMRACFRSKPEGDQFDFSLWAENGKTKMPPLWQLKYLPNMPASHIAILNDFHGPSNSITLREASIGACVGESVEIIASNRADMMLVGTTGSRLHPFKMLHALKNEELASRECRPFDRHREGTVLGEGAGALVLEEYEHAVRRNATIWAEVVCGSYRARFERTGLETGRNDHRREIVASVLREVLRRAEMEPEQIGHINAHGLGGPVSDRLEALGIHDVFGRRKKPISVAAAKGFFGNLGAGAGAVEMIAGVLSLRNNQLFPTLNCHHPGPDCPVSPTIGCDMPAGDSFIKLAINAQAQASAVLIRKI